MVPSLYVCDPSSTPPSIHQVLVYHGAKRSTSTEELEGADVVLTTYSIIENEFRRCGWEGGRGEGLIPAISSDAYLLVETPPVLKRKASKRRAVQRDADIAPPHPTPGRRFVLPSKVCCSYFPPPLFPLGAGSCCPPRCAAATASAASTPTASRCAQGEAGRGDIGREGMEYPGICPLAIFLRRKAPALRPDIVTPRFISIPPTYPALPTPGLCR